MKYFQQDISKSILAFGFKLCQIISNDDFIERILPVIFSYFPLSSFVVLIHTFVSHSADSRRSVVSYWRKYEHEVLINRLGGLSLPWKSVVMLTDHPDMTIDVYR